MAVDDAMRIAVKIFGRRNIADAIGGIVVEQKSAQHRLLRLQRVRRQLERIDLRIVGHRSVDGAFVHKDLRGGVG